MLVHDRLCAFAAGLESLLAARDSAEFEATWERHALNLVGWEALALARRADSATLEPILSAVDHRLLAVPGSGAARSSIRTWSPSGSRSWSGGSTPPPRRSSARGGGRRA
jgi:hypothetical protein